MTPIQRYSVYLSKVVGKDQGKRGYIDKRQVIYQLITRIRKNKDSSRIFLLENLIWSLSDSWCSFGNLPASVLRWTGKLCKCNRPILRWQSSIFAWFWPSVTLIPKLDCFVSTAHWPLAVLAPFSTLAVWNWVPLWYIRPLFWMRGQHNALQRAKTLVQPLIHQVRVN